MLSNIQLAVSRLGFPVSLDNDFWSIPDIHSGLSDICIFNSPLLSNGARLREFMGKRWGGVVGYPRGDVLLKETGREGGDVIAKPVS